MEASELPRFVVLKSNFNSNYVRYNREKRDLQTFLQCDGKEIIDPLSKFRLQRAKNDKNLFHILCCYNNKYWVRRDSDNYVVPAAEKPKEEQATQSLALFKVEPVDSDKKTFRLLYAQFGKYVSFLNDPKNSKHGCLQAANSTPDLKESSDVFTITDWETLVILPKYVAIKGTNGKYIEQGPSKHQYCLDFTATNKDRPASGNEIITNPDGSISIKYSHNGKFWRVNKDEWVYPDFSTGSTPETSFWPVRLQNNFIALRSMSNNRFCRRSSYGDNPDGGLVAASRSTSISNDARLEVEELLVKRKIFNMEFRLDECMYNETIVTLASATVTNKTDEEQEIEVKMAYRYTWSHRWSNSSSMSCGGSVKFSLGIPDIAELSTRFSTKLEEGYEWGRQIVKKAELTETVPVTVKPRTKTSVHVVAKRGVCDVPFSYIQKDMLLTGDQKDDKPKDDGIYTGVNCFNFTVKYGAEEII